MRKIDKSEILSKGYEAWVLKFKKDNHDKYNSSKNEHYFDIKMSLLYCQKGLCAYTEQELCDEKFIETSNWDDNKYTFDCTQEERNSIQGDLEHFDESLKPKNAWLWSNFFVVNVHSNCRIKLRKPIKNILKPDNANYSPDTYLHFDLETGFFSPQQNLEEEEKKDVLYMIETLGINCIYSQRKKYILDLIERKEVGLNVNPRQYPTAWKMTLNQLK